VDESRETEAV